MFAHAVGGRCARRAHVAADLHRGRAGARHGGRAADHVAAGALRTDRAGTSHEHRGRPGSRDRPARLRRSRGGGDRRPGLERREPGSLARAGRVVGGPADRVPAARRHRAPPEPVRAGGRPARPGSGGRPDARACRRGRRPSSWRPGPGTSSPTTGPARLARWRSSWSSTPRPPSPADCRWGRAWLATGEAFGALSAAVARIGVRGWRRTPPVLGTAVLMVVWIGGTAFDGLTYRLVLAGRARHQLGLGPHPPQHGRPAVDHRHRRGRVPARRPRRRARAGRGAPRPPARRTARVGPRAAGRRVVPRPRPHLAPRGGPERLRARVRPPRARVGPLRHLRPHDRLLDRHRAMGGVGPARADRASATSRRWCCSTSWPWNGSAHGRPCGPPGRWPR